MLQLKAVEPRGAEKGKEGKLAQTWRSKFHGMFWKWSLLYNHLLWLLIFFTFFFLISLDCYSVHFSFCFSPLVHLSILPNFSVSLCSLFLCSHDLCILWFANKTPTLYSRKAYCSHHGVLLPACLNPKGDISLFLGPVIYILCLKALWCWPLGFCSAQREETQQSLCLLEPIPSHLRSVCVRSWQSQERNQAGVGREDRCGTLQKTWNIQSAPENDYQIRCEQKTCKKKLGKILKYIRIFLSGCVTIFFKFSLHFKEVKNWKSERRHVVWFIQEK